MSLGIFTDNWRMKLLAIGLAVLMLAAVAFSQNPPTTGSATVSLTYANIPANLILTAYPTTVTVTYSGVANLIKDVKASNLLATVDVSHAKPGNNVLKVVASSTTGSDINVQNPLPINVVADTYVQNVPLEVQVNARAAAGWSITKTASECPATPCVVHFSGPNTWTKNLSAYVTYPGQVNLGSIDYPNQTVVLQNINSPHLDLTGCKTDPCATLDTLTASIHIEAVAGSNSSTVTLLDSPPSHPPANGYRITQVTITPNTVVISGDPATLGRLRAITLPALDLSGRTSDAMFQVAITYPDGVSSTVANAVVKYSISPNPSVTPSP